MGSDVLTLDDPPVQKPPIIGTAIASYVFLFRNFGHAVKMGWPYLIIAALSFFYILYIDIEMRASMIHSHEAAADFNFSKLRRKYFLTDILFGIVQLTGTVYFLSALMISWSRAVTKGISPNNFCHPLNDAGLILSSYFHALLMPLQMASIFAPSYLRIVARANNETLSSTRATNLFKGLLTRFRFSVVFVVISLFFVISFVINLSDLLMSSAVYASVPSMVVGFIMVAILPYVLTGILGAYYLWFRQHPNWQQYEEQESEETYFPTSL